MDSKLVYWSAALAILTAVVSCATLGIRHAQRREFLAHRRLMLASCWLVAGFLASYVIKVCVLGREQLQLWAPRDVSALRVHEAWVSIMLLCGAAAVVRAARAGLLRVEHDAEIGSSDPRMSGHRWAGRIAIGAGALGLATAAYLLWGMYRRAGLL